MQRARDRKGLDKSKVDWSAVWVASNDTGEAEAHCAESYGP